MPLSQTRTTLTALWAALHVYQFGMAVSSLNGIQMPMSCGLAGAPPPDLPLPDGAGASGASSAMRDWPRWWSACVPMNATEFGFIVAVFTVGGMVSAGSCSSYIRNRGVINTLRISASAVLFGTVVMMLGETVPILALGRFLIGIGCGVATPTVPLVLAELAPPHRRKALGILTQISIVSGVLLAQSLSFPFGKEYIWRFVPAVSAAVAVLQLVGSLAIKLDHEPHTPSVPSSGSDEEPLLGPEAGVATQVPAMSVADLMACKEPRIRRAFWLVLMTQLGQQITGIAGVMYFSTRIMTPVFPASAKLVALAIVIWKVPITVVPAFLIERVGVRPLLVYPTLVMSLSSILLAVGINRSEPISSVAGVMVYVTAFSLGLGPVAWVVAPEVMPPEARAAASAIGLQLNWATNFVVGVTFLPLQQYLSGGVVSREGDIFYLFAVLCFAGAVAIQRAYRALEQTD